MIKHPCSLRQPLSDQTIQALLRVARGEWRGLILMCLHTGQRLPDIAQLPWNSVDLEENRIRFRIAKTQLQHSVPITPRLREYLETLATPAERTGPLFPASAKESSSALRGKFRKLTTRAGVDVRVFDALRITFWLRLQLQFLPSAQLRQLLGHQTKAVSYRYGQSDPTNLKKQPADPRGSKERKGPIRPPSQTD